MSLKPPSVGSDVECMCGKCKLETWHVVLAMMGREIARVQCKSCGAQHRFRRPGGVTKRTRSTSTTGGKKRARTKAEPEPVGPTVEANTKRPIKAYRASEMFEVAERVNHPKFGLGVVEQVEPGKATIYFPSGRRVLAMAKDAPKLTRPAPFRYDD